MSRAVLQPTRRRAVAELPRPPAGAEKRGPARRDQAVLQPTRRPPGLAEPPAGAEKRAPPRRGRRNNPHPAYASGVKRSVER